MIAASAYLPSERRDGGRLHERFSGLHRRVHHNRKDPAEKACYSLPRLRNYAQQIVNVKGSDDDLGFFDRVDAHLRPGLDDRRIGSGPKIENSDSPELERLRGVMLPHSNDTKDEA